MMMTWGDGKLTVCVIQTLYFGTDVWRNMFEYMTQMVTECFEYENYMKCVLGLLQPLDLNATEHL